VRLHTHLISQLLANAPLFLLGILLSSGVLAENYYYPFSNPYISTIVGTPEEYQAVLPQTIPLQTYSLDKEVGPKIPDIFWYQSGFEYSVALQKFRAPLIFVIAGTGADHKSEKNLVLLKAFYNAGFHVIGLSSPSHHNFITTASRTGIPGHLEEDAFDLYQVMQRISQNLEGKTDVSRYLLTGYSLGGAHAAFVSNLDEHEKAFSFERVLLLNPPLSMYASISKLDRMLENIPGGVDHFNKFFDMLVQRISAVYRRSSKAEFNEALIYEAFKYDRPSDEQLAAIIGTAFRLSAANMIFATDVITNIGFVKSKELTLNSGNSLDAYFRLCMRIGFTDYYHELLFPYFKNRQPLLTRESLANQLSLLHIEGYLKNTAKIGLVHNRDDIILVKGDIDIFEDMFGVRAKLFPTGGHLGNLQQQDTLAYIVNYFK